MIHINGKRYRAHRLAWLYMTGEWPRHFIDHIDGNNKNNRFDNLRDVPQSVNRENQRNPRRGSKSGLQGVSEAPKGSIKPWIAQITVRGEKIYLGTYDDPLEAHAVYINKKRELHAGYCG